MNILLLNPPFLSEHGVFSRPQRSPAITKSGTVYFPMWLAYATGALEKAGHQCMLIDAPADKLDFMGVLNRLGTFEPELVVVDTSTPSIYNDIEMAARFKVRNSAFTVLVGTHPTALPEETMDISRHIDAICTGEYEMTLVRLAEVLAGNGRENAVSGFRDIGGLVYRNGDQVVVNKPSAAYSDLDDFPYVSSIYKKHLDFRNYFYSFSKHPFVVIITGRGCPHKCIYCQYPHTFTGRNVRFRKVSKVVDEIEYILKNFPGIREISFEDDTLTQNKARAIEFSKEIIRRGLKFVWTANSRCQVDFETLKWLRDAGAKLFCVGVESGSQKILDNLNKNLKVDEITQFFSDAKEVGIKLHGCFMFGSPGETFETMRTTLEFAKKLNPHTAQFFPMMVYPGTRAYEWALQNDYLTSRDFRDWLTENGRHNCVVSRPDLTSEDLVKFCDQCRKEFYLRPSYIAQKLGDVLHDPAEFKTLFIGATHLFLKNMFNR